MTQTEIDKIYRTIGARIREMRLSSGLSQEQLAAESDIDRVHIGFIEQGRRKPTITTLAKIVKALNTTIEELFRGL